MWNDIFIQNKMTQFLEVFGNKRKYSHHKII